MTALSRQDIELATRAADHFQRLYYTAYDSDTRADTVPNFYRPNSAIAWNGSPHAGADGIRQLLMRMPKTKHDVLSYDCHPIPGPMPPSLLLTVSGNVTHGEGPEGNPRGAPPKTIEGHPRVFTQTFVLAPDSTVALKPGEVAKYYILADTVRFVG
ncbi:NTF2-like protein [Peniophora sp. CONT]|nr:NTF2-like protein [Peniophora sp. CONT]